MATQDHDFVAASGIVDTRAVSRRRENPTAFAIEGDGIHPVCMLQHKGLGFSVEGPKNTKSSSAADATRVPSGLKATDVTSLR